MKKSSHIFNLTKNKKTITGIGRTEKNSFSIIEVVIALSIVIIGFMGILFSLTKFLKLDSVANNKLTAIYLAQEGLEAVRNIRDANWRQSMTWDDGIDSADMANPSIVVLDTNSNSWTLETGDNNIYYDPDSGAGADFVGFLQSDSPSGDWEETIFTRKILVDKNNPDGDSDTDDIKITSEVSYGNNSTIIIETFIYGWWQSAP